MTRDTGDGRTDGENLTGTDDHEPHSPHRTFIHDGVEVSMMPTAYRDHADVTTVFCTSNSSEVFHADEHCYRLHQSEPRRFRASESPKRTLRAFTLEEVMTSLLNPIRPCDYCSQPIQKLAESVKQQRDLTEAQLKYFEPGDERVTRTISRTGDGVSVSESAQEVYE